MSARGEFDQPAASFGWTGRARAALLALCMRTQDGAPPPARSVAAQGANGLRPSLPPFKEVGAPISQEVGLPGRRRQRQVEHAQRRQQPARGACQSPGTGQRRWAVRRPTPNLAVGVFTELAENQGMRLTPRSSLPTASEEKRARHPAIGARPPTCRSARSTYGQPMPARAAGNRARSSRGCSGHWGHHPGLTWSTHSEPHPPQPRCQRPLPHGTGQGGPDWSPKHTWRAPTARLTGTKEGRRRSCGRCSGSSQFGASQTTWRQTPGSIHEGGNSATPVHGYGAALDNPDCGCRCRGRRWPKPGAGRQLALNKKKKNHSSTRRRRAACCQSCPERLQIANPTVARIPNGRAGVVAARIRHRTINRRRRTIPTTCLNSRRRFDEAWDEGTRMRMAE